MGIEKACGDGEGWGSAPEGGSDASSGPEGLAVPDTYILRGSPCPPKEGLVLHALGCPLSLAKRGDKLFLRRTTKEMI